MLLSRYVFKISKDDLKQFYIVVLQDIDAGTFRCCIKNWTVQYHSFRCSPIIGEQQATMVCEGKNFVRTRDGKLEGARPIIPTFPTVQNN